jgi:hypothetical protein
LFIKFKAGAHTGKIQMVKDLFLAVPHKIPGVSGVEWGVNDSPEGKNAGYTHVVLMTFADEAGRQNYLPHPEHEALKLVFGPLLDDIIVLDYPC